MHALTHLLVRSFVRCIYGSLAAHGDLARLQSADINCALCNGCTLIPPMIAPAAAKSVSKGAVAASKA